MRSKGLYATLVLSLFAICLCGCKQADKTVEKDPYEYYEEYYDTYMELVIPILDMTTDKMILEHLTSSEAEEAFERMEYNLSEYITRLSDSGEIVWGDSEEVERIRINMLKEYIDRLKEKSDEVLESGVSPMDTGVFQLMISAEKLAWENKDSEQGIAPFSDE